MVPCILYACLLIDEVCHMFYCLLDCIGKILCTIHSGWTVSCSTWQHENTLLQVVCLWRFRCKTSLVTGDKNNGNNFLYILFREGRSDCLCSTCTSHPLDENAVKIVKVKPGYVSVVAKLKTDDCVQCILVCEPKHLIAVGESGKLHLWEMNSSWRWIYLIVSPFSFK